MIKVILSVRAVYAFEGSVRSVGDLIQDVRYHAPVDFGSGWMVKIFMRHAHPTMR